MFYGKISMMYFIYCHALPDLDKFITRDMFFDNSFHFIIHRCRKCKCLFYIFEMSSYSFDITDKSHVQHSVYFVQDKIFSNTNIDHFLIHKIHQPPWCRDNNCRIFLEDIFLDKRTCSTIKTSKRHSIKFRQTPDLFSNLHNKLSRRS